MVDQALTFLAAELNEFIGNKDHRYRGTTVAMVSDLVDEKGELTYKKRIAANLNGDFLLLTLINVEEETIGKAQQPYLKHPDQSYDLLNPPIRVNLYILLSAVSTRDESERYTNCLKMLSYGIGFFQYKAVFEKLNAPSLPDEIEKLIMELVSPTFEQQNHIWGGMGAKYLPSAMYKVRLLHFRENLTVEGAGVVRRVKTEINEN
ncbi:MAG TPA: DUF4255 domain-containing protein [Cyclobacteriaceae bacterium]|nr:DUF4255 domain-containing protein [Cyclobacteriaceae bacterium]